MARILVGEVVGSTFRTVFQNLGLFLRAVGVFSVASALIGLLVALRTQSTLTDVIAQVRQGAKPFQAMLPSLAGAVAVGVVGFLVGIASFLVASVVAARLEEGRRLSLREAWAEAGSRYGNLAITGLLVFLLLAAILLLGALLSILILPFFLALGLIVALGLRWSIAGAVGVFERRSPGGNLTRSRDLTKGSRGAILGALILVCLVFVVPEMAVGIPFDIVSRAQARQGLPPPMGLTLANWAVTAVAGFFGTCLWAAFNAVVYRRLAASEPSAEAPPAPEPTLGPIGGP